VLLWLWCRPAAAAPIRPLAWEFPYATGMALSKRHVAEKKKKKKKGIGVPVMAQWLTNLRTMRLQVRSLALLSGLRIQRCGELWCRSQTWLGSCIAVALTQASGYRSNWTPGLGTSIYHGSGPRKGKKKKKKKKEIKNPRRWGKKKGIAEEYIQCCSIYTKFQNMQKLKQCT